MSYPEKGVYPVETEFFKFWLKMIYLKPLVYNV